MPNTFIKAELVIKTMLGLLERELVLPRLVWRDAIPSFKGAKDDTVSVRVPAFAVARTRELRGGRPIDVDSLSETKVDITLDTDVYKAVAITDEELTLDIVSFGDQVLKPVVRSVAVGLEDSVASVLAAADFALQVENVDETDPFDGVVDARRLLNDARVPVGGRTLLMGSAFEAATLKSERFSKFDGAGPDAKSAREEAYLGRIAGFESYPCPVLDPEKAIAMHKTAVAMSVVAPVVPEGAAWGTSESVEGLAMRVLRDYDFLNVQDRLLADAFTGSAVVADRGTLNEETGVFTPSEDGEDEPIFVRAVELSLDDLGS